MRVLNCHYLSPDPYLKPSIPAKSSLEHHLTKMGVNYHFPPI